MSSPIDRLRDRPNVDLWDPLLDLWEGCQKYADQVLDREAWWCVLDPLKALSAAAKGEIEGDA